MIVRRNQFPYASGLLVLCISGLILIPHHVSAQDESTPDKVTQDKTEPAKAIPDKSAPDKSAPDKAAPDKAAPDKTTPDAPKTDAKPDPGAAPPKAAPDTVDSAAIEQYRAEEKQWRVVLTDLRKLQVRHKQADDDEAKQIEAQWDELLVKARKLLASLRESGKKAYQAAPNADRALTRFLIKLMLDDLNREHYESANEMAQLLIDNLCEDPRTYAAAGEAAFVLNDFDKAEEYLNKAKEAGVLSEDSPTHGYLANLADYKKFWEEEKKLRQAEAEAEKDNLLPRIKLTTSKGDVIVELFENEAPDTVGNFVSLVSNGFYDGKEFHRVLPKFMAQGGSLGGGQGGPGYMIYCECHKDNYRKHFRGTLSMAHAGRDTGGSQFFLTFVPTPHLNGKHTAFGRVIEGMDVLAKLQRIDPADTKSNVEPDKIVKAEVLQKREHEYVPHKVEQ